MFIISAANINFAYAVSYDGEILCYARDWSKLQVVIDKVEKIASEALGYDFSLDSELTTRLSIESKLPPSMTSWKPFFLTVSLKLNISMRYCWMVMSSALLRIRIQNAALVGLVNDI